RHPADWFGARLVETWVLFALTGGGNHSRRAGELEWKDQERSRDAGFGKAESHCGRWESHRAAAKDLLNDEQALRCADNGIGRKGAPDGVCSAEQQRQR